MQEWLFIGKLEESAVRMRKTSLKTETLCHNLTQHLGKNDIYMEVLLAALIIYVI